MNRLIVFAPFVVLILVAIGVAALFSWNIFSTERERIAAMESRNEILENNIKTYRRLYGVLTTLLDSTHFRDHRSMIAYAKSLNIETEDVLTYLALYESQLEENLEYLPDGKYSYPDMVQVLGDRLRETETRLRVAEAKLREKAESTNAIP